MYRSLFSPTAIISIKQVQDKYGVHGVRNMLRSCLYICVDQFDVNYWCHLSLRINLACLHIQRGCKMHIKKHKIYRCSPLMYGRATSTAIFGSFASYKENRTMNA